MCVKYKKTAWNIDFIGILSKFNGNFNSLLRINLIFLEKEIYFFQFKIVCIKIIKLYINK